MSLPKYEKYKESGVSWVGAIPNHWKLLRTKTLFELKKRPPREEDGVVTAFRDGEVTLRSNRRTEGFTNSLQEIGYQGVRQGDLVIHAMDAFAGAIGVSDSDGKSTPVYSVCEPKHGLSNSRYYARLLRYMALSGFIESLAKGIRERSTEFRWAEAGNVYLPVPPIDEQTAIAAFLDRETAKIDALIAEQEQLILLLAEKRQATISHAVTKGLNPNAAMKDSGVAWLGEVPAHWNVATFQRYVYVQEGQVNPEEEPYRSMLLIAPNHIESGTGRLLYVETAQEQSAESGKYLCKSGDVIYSKIRPALRKVCIAPEDCLCSADMYPLRGTSTLSNSFLKWFMLSEPFSVLAVLESERVAMPKINRESLKTVWLPIPTPQEQEAIDFFLLKETTKLDSMKEEASRAIKLLSERRSALIAAAVTGQIDVRGPILQPAIESPEALAA